MKLDVYLICGVTGTSDVNPLFSVDADKDGQVDSVQVAKAIMDAGVLFEAGDELRFEHSEG